MALPKAARKAIKAEVARLKQVEVMARQKRRAAELLLADDDDLVAFVNYSGPTERVYLDNPPVAVSGNGNAVGLRPVILDFLRSQHTEPVKAREVISQVEQSAYKPQGKTPLRVRVTAELYRLVREGKVERVVGKRFKIREASQPHLTG